MKSAHLLLSLVLSASSASSVFAAPKDAACVVSRSVVDEAIPGWKTISPNVGVNVLVQITADGYWQFCPNCSTTVEGLKTNPDNVPGPEHLFHPGTTVGTLIGKIGNGEIFSIKSNTAFVSATQGPLQVRMNDLAASGDVTTDNSGKINVVVKLCRPSP